MTAASPFLCLPVGSVAGFSGRNSSGLFLRVLHRLGGLAEDFVYAGFGDAQAFGEESKKVYSMYFQRKYGEEGILRRVKVKALWLDTPSYLRNTLAYIPRNALDNGGDIVNYPWSGHLAMFRQD